MGRLAPEQPDRDPGLLEAERPVGEALASPSMHENSFVVGEPSIDGRVSIEREEFCHLGSTSSDEVCLALIDTACTACMHSMNWRKAFELRLPPSVKFEPLQQFKTFHFANGSSTASQIQAWRIPICLGGRPGDVHSAEVPEGNTPLLLSIPALDALDAVVFMRKRCLRLQELGVTIPLIRTGTKHLAIDVSFETLEVETVRTEASSPILKSEADDMHVFWLEEAQDSILQDVLAYQVTVDEEVPWKNKPNMTSRGITIRDIRKELHVARFDALKKAAIDQQVLDAKMWVALRHHYTKAEEFVTRGFKQTVIFEPWGGTFPVTRLASLSRGWINSQPMDVKDGVDLLSRDGQALVWGTLEMHDPYLPLIAFDCRLWSALTNLSQHIDWDQLCRTIGKRTLELVKAIAVHRHRVGKFYLLENPGGALSWLFQGILMSLIDEADGKFVEGDQCRYGKVDEATQKPVKKRRKQ